MKHGIVIHPFCELNYGQTVEILESSGGTYIVRPHGGDRNIMIYKENIQVAEDIYNYSTNPTIRNTYEG